MSKMVEKKASATMSAPVSETDRSGWMKKSQAARKLNPDASSPGPSPAR